MDYGLALRNLLKTVPTSIFTIICVSASTILLVCVTAIDEDPPWR